MSCTARMMLRTLFILTVKKNGIMLTLSLKKQVIIYCKFVCPSQNWHRKSADVFVAELLSLEGLPTHPRFYLSNLGFPLPLVLAHPSWLFTMPRSGWLEQWGPVGMSWRPWTSCICICVLVGGDVVAVVLVVVGVDCWWWILVCWCWFWCWCWWWWWRTVNVAPVHLRIHQVKRDLNRAIDTCDIHAFESVANSAENLPELHATVARGERVLHYLCAKPCRVHFYAPEKLGTVGYGYLRQILSQIKAAEISEKT